MKNENTNQKRKIARCLLLILLSEIIFALVCVFRTCKSISEVNVMDNTIMLKFYIGVFVGLVALTVVLIIAVVCYTKAISFNEK